MIGHQQAATGITGLKTTLQLEGAGDGAPVQENAGAQENGEPVTAESAPKMTNPVMGLENTVETMEGNEGDEKKENEGEEEEEEEEPIDMSFPIKEGWQKILLYLISFPIMAPLYVTLPDTKDKSSMFLIFHFKNILDRTHFAHGPSALCCEVCFLSIWA